MKMKHGLIWVVTLFTGLATVLAADNPPPLPVPGTNTPAPASAPAPAPVDTTATSTNKPAVKKTAKKKDATKKAVAKKKEKAAEPEAVPLLINEPAVSKQNHVNVRAQSHINSEIITHLKQGETVTVLEEVTLKHPKTDEPAKWARIALPAGSHVWINTPFIDATSQTVKPAKLNIRSGAGENYSVIGTLVKGDAVKTVTTKGEWTEIEAPTNAFGFVAAQFLTHKALTEPATPPPVTPTPTIVENAPPIAAPPTATVDTPPATPVPAVTPEIPTPLPAPTDEPPPKRIVQREGIVGGTVSIQAPSHYELKSIDDGRVIDYLYTTSSNVVLKKYKGRTVLVSGEEELDERWANTPVITIQKIQVVE